MCGYDVFKQNWKRGRLVQCTDGLYSVVVDAEICEISVHAAPEGGGQQLMPRLKKRHTETMFSVKLSVLIQSNIGFLPRRAYFVKQPPPL